MPATSEDLALQAFADAFPGRPTILARAPGRVELLGNHTDYNGGLVLAAAIDRYTVVAGRAANGREAVVRSANYEHPDRFDVDRVGPGHGESDTWGRYVQGVTWALRERQGKLASGFEAALGGDVPIGAGLSSSASLQAAFALFLIGSGLAHGDLANLDRMALAQTLRRSENEFVGVASGLLDQFSVLFGKADHALRLDCLTNEYEVLPLGHPAPAIIVCDSKTSRRLADGMYNQRHAECERVVDYFRERKEGVQVANLRAVTLDELMDAWQTLEPAPRKRARHVLTENLRVEQGADALKAGEVAVLGSLMTASHASSRDDFENSSPALDALIEAAQAAPGFLGGKLSGAGWAGCTVNLVEAGSAGAFAESVKAGYARATGIVPDVHICHAAEGAFARPIG